ncbi:hypothetical protein BDDG_11563 [Blastomyces dermatitidis ATCC 18188]|uniref:Uncharacterized protein n=1 Tax=Ajellomyces dermatitidis (strain ATCC 18188 / CBS 674.68) TaxID=653446 RepID=A0A0J9HBV4_AJEDA|nr:hypothetical protein BDDG_11563 [Blastomyces dermatitidis ATCC 18188]
MYCTVLCTYFVRSSDSAPQNRVSFKSMGSSRAARGRKPSGRFRIAGGKRDIGPVYSVQSREQNNKKASGMKPDLDRLVEIMYVRIHMRYFACGEMTWLSPFAPDDCAYGEPRHVLRAGCVCSSCTLMYSTILVADKILGVDTLFVVDRGGR